MSRPQRSDLDHGWSWIVMIASFASLCIIGGMNFSVGLIHATLLERYGKGQSVTSWAGALHTSVMSLAAPISSLIINRYSVRVAVMISGLLFTVGYLATAFAPTLGISVFTCGIISGLGGAIGWTASMIAPGFHFSKYRNLALGFAMTGNAVGLFCTAPAIQAAKSQYGSTGFFIVLACISIHQIVFGMLMKPSSLEIQTKKHRELENKQNNNDNIVPSYVSGYVNTCASVPIFILSCSFFFLCISLYSFFMHLPNYCTYSGHSAMKASYLLSILAISSIFGRIFTGCAANLDNINGLFLHTGSLICIGIAAMLFPFYGKSYAGQIILAVIVGFFFGTPFVTATPINIDIVGVHNMAATLSNELFLGGIGGILGPVLTSNLLDKGLSYNHIIIIAGAVELLAALLSFLTYFIMRRSQYTTNPSADRFSNVLEIKPKESESRLEKTEF